MRVFQPKKPLSENRKDAEGNELSATQQSQSKACEIEEGWAKKKPKKEKGEAELLQLIRLRKKDYFGDWTQTEIATFLTTEFFIEQKMRIDRSAISRIFTDKPEPSPPGKEKCDILRDIFYNRLPKRTVYSEGQLIGFQLLPNAARRIHDLISSPTELQMEPNIISNVGDAYVKLSYMQRLVLPEEWSEDESRY